MCYEFEPIYNHENRILIRRLGPLAIKCEVDAAKIEAEFAAIRHIRDAMLMWPWEARLQLALPNSTAWALHPTGLRHIADVIGPCLGRAHADSRYLYATYVTETSEQRSQLHAIQTAVYVREHVGLSPDTPITIDLVDATADTPPDLYLVPGS